MNIKIFVSHSPNHHDSEIKNSNIYVNVEAGAALSNREAICGDNIGDNISIKNPAYCELTTQYWAWKNQDADYYGFCHYRRYFSFNPLPLRESRWYRVELPVFSIQAIMDICADDSTIQSIVPEYDFMVAKGIDTRLLNGSKNVFEHYSESSVLNIEDLETVLQIIKEKYPQILFAAHKYIYGHTFYPCNMFIAKRDLFEEYSAFLFDILEEFEKRRDISNYSKESLRTPGHLGERILGIYYTYLKETKKYRLKELQQVFFNNVNSFPDILYEEKNIPIVLAANNKYVPILDVCIQSIADHSKEKNHYSLYILHTNIATDRQNAIERQLRNYPNITIYFIDVSTFICNYQLKAKAHISTETFYRFLILELLKNYKKAVYLDCDTIVQEDIANLYHIDIGDHLVGAALDPDFIGQCHKKNCDTREYAENILKINPLNYFQAGILVLNIEALRKNFTVDFLLTMAEDIRYRYSDQDVLNIICKNKWYNIGMRWNLLTDCDHTRISDVISYAPKYILEEYENARKDPAVVHFAGFMKPWNKLGEDYGELFWNIARKTFYYEELLYILQSGPPSPQNKDEKKIIAVYNLLFPENGSIRNIIRLHIKPFFYKSKIGMKIIKYMR